MFEKDNVTQQEVDAVNEKVAKCENNQQIVETLKTVKKAEIEVMPVASAEQYKVSDVRYVPYYEHDTTGGLEFEFYTSHMNAVKSPLLLTGPTGTAKTLSVAAYAAHIKALCLQVDCSEGTKRADLIGRFIILDGSVKFQLGTIPHAIEIANQTGQAIIDFEEAAYYYRVFDIGMAIIGSCSVGKILKQDKIKSFLLGYAKEIKLIPNEKRVLQAFTVYAGAAMCFWRHRNFNYVHPNMGLNDHYKALQTLANYAKTHSNLFFD